MKTDVKITVIDEKGERTSNSFVRTPTPPKSPHIPPLSNHVMTSQSFLDANDDLLVKDYSVYNKYDKYDNIRKNGAQTGIQSMYIGSDKKWKFLAPRLPEENDNNYRPLFYYSCGRPSMIWENKSNVKEANTRVTDLSVPKQPSKEFTNQEIRPQYLFSCGRSSPIWTVQKGALSAGDRPRTQSLANPRPPHKEFQPSRQVESIIPGGALSASASERIHTLATPKERPNGPFRPPQWPVTPGARNAISSTRCADLARPKATVEGYQLPRDEMWPVTRAAKRGSASGRIQELCRPLVRASMDHVQFNPDAFLVKETALKGQVPKRVEELSQPIQR
ncbi:testicular haploid expressed gene protein-like isoform X4 [Pecten maximus]|uniref:testicular haploid expressed gene protein-like isoform X4 n=1 Tax=Pecten maximus TaxID=6579 RepID=UPI001458E63C|nr:testicular haploid expressed gene protein-like isoform X4 [Pecten maximus]